MNRARSGRLPRGIELTGSINVSTPTAERINTIFVAIELSQKSWLVTMHSPDRDRISRHKVAGGDYAGLLRLIEGMRERAARAVA